MKIEIDTNNLSEMDIAMLGFLAGEGTEDETEPEAPAPTPVKTPKKTAPVVKPAPTPAPAPEPEEDLVGGDAPTMSDAVAAATVLVSSGGATKVKEALAAVNAKRVSEMKTEDIPAFLAALQA